MEKLRTVRGVHDLLPDILHKQNLVINEGLKISEKYCYQQIETPIFEFAEVFTKPLGKTSDIVTKENYITFNLEEDSIFRSLRTMTFRKCIGEYDLEDLDNTRKIIEIIDKINKTL